MDKTIIFIDGSNFYHNSKKVGVIPKLIDFEKLCTYICKRLNLKWNKTICYNAIPDISESEDKYYNHMKFLSELKKISKFEVKTRKLQKLSTKEIQDERRNIIKNGSFCTKCKSEAIKNCLSCIGDYQKKEKGIDVMIAVDMINKAIKKECNTIVLMSGDADFIPSLSLVKENKCKVIVCAPKPGFAHELRTTQQIMYLNKQDLEENCYKD